MAAVISFAGAGQRRQLFRGLDIFTIKCAIGNLPEECRFLLNTQHQARNPRFAQPGHSQSTPFTGSSAEPIDTAEWLLAGIIEKEL